MKADGTTMDHNPILKNEITQLKDTVNLSNSVIMTYVPFSNGKKLSDYASGCKVIYDSEGLAYFYLDFTDGDTTDADYHENKANDYFNDYYQANKSNVEEDLTGYDTMILKDTGTTPFSRLTNAGNVILMNAVSSKILNSSVREFLPTTFAEEAKAIAAQYAAMTKKLMLSIANTTVEDESSLYNSIINVSETDGLTSLIAAKAGAAATQATFESRDNAGNIIGNVILINNPSGQYQIDSNPVYPTVIIATGEVVVNTASFNGLIMAKGNIKISSAGVSHITADSDIIYEIISHSAANTVFRDDQWRGAAAGTGSTGTSQVDIGGLISFDNWKKN